MPKVSQSHLDARRQQILDAAIECFSREGFHHTTMQDIIRESGLSAGALYTYFSSKEEMIEAIADARHAREWEMIRAASVQDKIAFEQLMRKFFRVLLDPKRRKEQKLAIQLWAEALRNPRILRMVRKGVDEPRKMLTKIVQDGRDRGDLPSNVDPDGLARVMIALFQGLMLQLAWDRSTNVAVYFEVVEKIFALLSARVPSRI